MPGAEGGARNSGGDHGGGGGSKGAMPLYTKIILGHKNAYLELNFLSSCSLHLISLP